MQNEIENILKEVKEKLDKLFEYGVVRLDLTLSVKEKTFDAIVTRLEKKEHVIISPNPLWVNIIHKEEFDKIDTKFLGQSVNDVNWGFIDGKQKSS